MLRNRLLTICILLLSVLSAGAQVQSVSINGTVTDKQSGAPVEFATVIVEGTGQWAVADAKGAFILKNIPTGKASISVSCLGYVTDTREIVLSKDIPSYKISLSPDNLSLDGAVVTAKDNESSATTSRTIDKTALDHVQVMNVADISSLLPGGATPTNSSLTSEQTFNLRAGSGEGGNATFGTAVEVDGIRLSSNASFAGASSTGTNLKGVSTNNIASSNIESVEVITGVPSVEYGDMTSGVVKINTRKGKTPWTVTMSTSPNTKQTSVSKGFGLGSASSGASRGILNASLEYTNSISEPMSPYTSYDRKQISLTYSNLLSRGVLSDMPLRFSASFTGNLGGLDSSKDPDAMIGTYEKTSDNTIRGNVTMDWLLSRSWITNIEAGASVIYSDKLGEVCSRYNGAVSTMALHATQEGYYISREYDPASENPVVAIPPQVEWYNSMFTDDRPLTYKFNLKANWAKNFGKVSNKVKIGGEFTSDRNLGTGQYSSDESLAPTYRIWRYCDVPAMNNAAAYLEDNLMIPVGKDGRLNLIAGIRNDNTMIKGSAYGTTSSLSPRFNAKYTAFTSKGRRNKTVKELSFRASWGEAVKLPSFAILYPQPTYQDINIFRSTAGNDNKTSNAYYILPRVVEYNPDLRWQKSRQAEAGADVNIDGTKISLAGFFSRTYDSYVLRTDYDRITYNYTPVSSVQGDAVPVGDRIYSVNPSNGSITIADRTGVIPPHQAESIPRKQFTTRYFEDNEDNPITRYGLEWVIDFKRIKPLNTTIRLDGTWYRYDYLCTDIVADSPYTTNGYDNEPYKYIGYYYGDDANSNGTRSCTVKTNLTVTTHIPKVRMILSMKVESSLVRTSQSLSEKLDGSARSYLQTDRTNMLAFSDGNFYGKGNYVITFPDTFCTYDDPAPKPFLETFRWAKQNDTKMYSDLSKLALTTAYDYMFAKDSISPYFCINISVTKEIGDLASLSFYANNFFNNTMEVFSSRSDSWSSVSSYIPRFNYGLTLRLKF